MKPRLTNRILNGDLVNREVLEWDDGTMCGFRLKEWRDARDAQKWALKMLQDITCLTPLIYSHVTPYGTFRAAFDFRAQFCHSAPMETHAFGLRLPANAPEGQKRFPIGKC
jgi:hypothetical protein